MNHVRKLLIITIFLSFVLLGCTLTESKEAVKIVGENQHVIEVGEELQLKASKTSGLMETFVWEASNDFVHVTQQGLVTGVKEGTSKVTVSIGSYSDSVQVQVLASGSEQETKIKLSISKTEILVDETAKLEAIVLFGDGQDQLEYEILSGATFVRLNGTTVTGLSKGTATIVAKLGEIVSNEVTIVVRESEQKQEIKLTISKTQILVNQTATLSAVVTPSGTHAPLEYQVLTGKSVIQLNGTTITGISKGTATIVAKLGEIVSNEVTITVEEQIVLPININITADKTLFYIGDTGTLSFTTIPSHASQDIMFEVIVGTHVIALDGNNITALAVGSARVVGRIGNVESNELTITVQDSNYDPYKNMSKTEFYSRYTTATSARDAYYRSQNNFMSGSIDAQDQEPTIAQDRPMLSGKYIRNSASYFEDGGSTYAVVNTAGVVVNRVYKDGAYVTLEEVAAYVLAFGDVPKNYTEQKDMRPKDSPWEEYLRLNNTYFSGDVKKYPFEPKLPDIRGNGGELYYYEIDLGTTGTDCDPDYPVRVYNDGNRITRGAARIVYTRYDRNNQPIIDINQKYVFYTYNHYNDFQEYLNYEGGWGEMFGNITGGGALSSKTDYNPTAYPSIVMQDFSMKQMLNTVSQTQIIQQLLHFILDNQKGIWVTLNSNVSINETAKRILRGY